MGLKLLANKAKGKRPIIEEEDSDFAPPLTKCGRAPPKKKTKVGVQEKKAEDVSGKNENVGGAIRTEVWDYKFSPSEFYRSKCFCTSNFSVIHNIKNTLSNDGLMVVGGLLMTFTHNGYLQNSVFLVAFQDLFQLLL
ncbi:hypothetical protein CsatA_001058 [Cannabis sativa]